MSPNVFLKNPFIWLHAISTFRGTCAGSPNFGWDYCVARISEEQKKQLDLNSLVLAYNGAEPVRASTLQRFYASFSSCGIRKETLFPCYGMAETTLFVSGGPIDKEPRVLNVSKSALEGNQIRIVAPDSDDARQIVSCGQISPYLTVVIVDPETLLPCSSRRLGEIWIAGDSVAQGYWDRPEETKKIFQSYLADSGAGPFLRSGDLGFLQDGELFVTGRSKDMIVINGRNIYPQDVEQVIEQTIDFVEANMCAAFSVEMEDRESLVIVAEANRSLMRAAQLEQTRRETDHNVKSDYFVKLERLASDICSVITDQFDVSVSSIVFVKLGTFPKTSSGKVQRLLCKQLALRGQLDIAYVMPDSIFDRRQASTTISSRTISATTAEASMGPFNLNVSACAAADEMIRPAIYQIDAADDIAPDDSDPDGSDPNGSDTASLQAARKMVHDCVIKWLRTEKRYTVDHVDHGASFASLGMDSLGTVMLSIELERRMGRELDPEMVTVCQTVNRLARQIDANFSDAARSSATQAFLQP